MERWGPFRNLLTLALLEASCETARSSVFNISRTREQICVCGVTVTKTGKVKALWYCSLLEQKPELRL